MDSKSNTDKTKMAKEVQMSNTIQATRTGLAKSFFSKQNRT